MIFAEAALRELATRFAVVEVGFDPWRFGAQAIDLSSAGLRMVQFPQTDSRLVPAGDEQVFARFGRTCWRCGAPATDVDHLTSIADGGSDYLANLRPACARCNRGRHD